MNLGIQDAYNLGWKLALVIKNKIHDNVLDSYHLERYPIAKKTISRTSIITKSSVIENFLLIDLRNLGFTILNKKYFTSKKFGDRITQLDYTYNNSSIIEYHTAIKSSSPLPGQHAPDVQITPIHRLHRILNNSKFSILLFTSRWQTNKQDTEFKKIQQWVKAKHPDLIEAIIIEKTNNNLPNSIFDFGETLTSKYHINGVAIYIIRPDKYIVYCSLEANLQHIKIFFETHVLECRTISFS